MRAKKTNCVFYARAMKKVVIESTQALVIYHHFIKYATFYIVNELISLYSTTLM